MWLGIFLLLAFLVFVVWDSRRLRNAKPRPLAREVLNRGFLPKGLVAWHFHLGLGGVLALLAFAEWEQPTAPPFAGRWSWLYQGLFDILGARGLLAWWALLAGLFLAYGVFLFRRERTGAPGSSATD